MKLKHSFLNLLSGILILPAIVFAQTDKELRDPNFLRTQYNQLVAKHNALIERTRILMVMAHASWGSW